VLPGFEEGAGTNPEELLAAAHAACFTMALALAVTEAGLEPPRSLLTRATVHLRFVDGAPAIQQIDLETEGDLPGLDEAAFNQYADEAKRSCIISRALGGVEEITSRRSSVPTSAMLADGSSVPQPSSTFFGGGRVVQPQRSSGGRWRTIERVRLNRYFAVIFRPRLARGRSTLRVAMSINQAGAGYLAGFSRTISYRVR
jgi:lipoyl-dependent peroxiredoxin